MKKRAQFEIVVSGISGINTTFIRKSWKGVASLMSKMETEYHNIWLDAYCVSIYCIDSEARLVADILRIKEGK